jgi:hypothetical protein
MLKVVADTDYLFDREAGSSEHKADKEGKPQYVCFDEDKIQQVFDMGSPVPFYIREDGIQKHEEALKRLWTPKHKCYLMS